jgi:hypothetical protein
MRHFNIVEKHGFQRPARIAANRLGENHRTWKRETLPSGLMVHNGDSWCIKWCITAIRGA